jgi:hypothetical protein
MSNDRRKTFEARLAKPDLKTSRRNFLAGASVLAGALAGAMVAGREVHAGASDQGCLSSNGRPKSCNTTTPPPPEGGMCFLCGTGIATPDGEVQIEKLEIGDLVLTASEKSKPIKWIGRNRYTRAASEAWKPGLTPVKISRFALDGHAPHADLYLSPAHAIYLRGILVPVKDLVNGISITQGHFADALTLQYYHIDLEDHDVLFAEGAPAETYQGNDYPAFDNADEYLALYGTPVGSKKPFAPIVSYRGGRQELKSRIRSVISPLYDVREPLDIIRDEIASRAELAWAA